jgi:SAM-dependent methyltransferase
MAQPYSSPYDRSIHGTWRAYAAIVRLLHAQPSGRFAEEGLVQGTLEAATVATVLKALGAAEFMALEADDSLPGFRRSEKVRKVAPALNAGHRYYRLGPAQLSAMMQVLDDLRRPVAAALGSPWRVLNVRALQTLPEAEAMGPNAWHGDGFPPAILKIMVYLTPAGARTGTTEFERAGGGRLLIEGPEGTWALFRNSVLIHRGLPPQEGRRVVIEITLAPSLTFDLRPIVAGLNATYPEYPWSLNAGARSATDLLGGWLRAHGPGKPAKPPKAGKPGKPANAGRPGKPAKAAKPMTAGKVEDTAEKAARTSEKAARAREKAEKARRKREAVRRHQGGTAWERVRKAARRRWVLTTNRLLPPAAVNIGGGPEFLHPRWLNLEGAPGPSNPHPFPLSATCTFPLGDATVSTVYTSHCIEHLDEDTVARVMSESRRVLEPDGRLVVKIPDFEMVLDRWRAADAGYFSDDRWGYRRLTATWPAMGVSDTLGYRAAMIFCGAWNEDYGDHFGGTRSGRVGAYHGPAPVSEAQLEALKTGSSPHEVARVLREAVLALPGAWTFNHQNAWSRDELAEVLARAGFEVVTFDAAAVVAAAADVPGIKSARDESLYCLARPRG